MPITPRPFDFAPLRGDPRRMAKELAREGLPQRDISAKLIAKYGTGDTSSGVGSNQWLGRLAGRAVRERPTLSQFSRGQAGQTLPESVIGPAAPWRAEGYTYGVYVQLQDANGARDWRYMEITSATSLTKGQILDQAAAMAVTFYSSRSYDGFGGAASGLKRTGRMNVVFAEKR